MKYDAFISYSSADSDAVTNIFDYLTGELVGLRCWRDNSNIRMGGDYTGEIPEGIDQASVFLLILTKSSQVSEWVRKEVSYALSNGKTVIPLKISNFELNPDMRFLLGNVQILDISGDMEKGLLSLEEVLKKRLEEDHESPWYVSHLEELEQRALIVGKKEKAENRRLQTAKRKKLQKQKQKERAAMAKALGNSVRKTARKASDRLNQGLDVTTEEGAAAKLVRIRNRVLGTVLAAAALALLIFVLNTRAHTIPLSDYVSVEFDGYDSIGTARVVFDERAFNDRYSRKIKAAKEKGIEAYSLLGGVSISVSPSERLSNGDTVVLNIDTDRMQFQNEYGYRLKYQSTKKIKVKDLLEAELFDPFANLDVTFEGFDGHGVLKAERRSGEGYLGEGEFIFSQVENLKNGDQVTVSFSPDSFKELSESMMQKYGTVPDKSEEVLTVSGLKEIEGFDAFQDLTVAFEGISGSGTVRLSLAKDLPENLKLTAKPYEGLSNGDEVTVTLTNGDGDDPSQYCESVLGLKVDALSKSYKVFGLSEYLDKISRLDPALRDEILKQAEDYYSSYVLNSYPETMEAGDMKYAGAYLITEKKGTVGEFHNLLTFCFRSDVTCRSEELKRPAEYRYYWYLQYRDVLLDPEGKIDLTVTEYLRSPEKAVFQAEDRELATFRGYSSMQELRADVADRYREYYNVDSVPGEKD